MNQNEPGPDLARNRELKRELRRGLRDATGWIAVGAVALGVIGGVATAAFQIPPVLTLAGICAAAVALAVAVALGRGR